jgi:predicted flap endonuclease-1-like 5' DNA nuclease
MTALAEHNLVPILIALAVGVIVAFWALRRRSTASGTRAGTAAPAARVRPEPAHEGRGLIDETAAATTDVAGDILGVRAHSELPGASGPPDNLQTMKGVGPKLAAQLNENGITRFDQLARLSPNEVALLEERLGAFKGRVTRDRLVDQAAYLARGDTDGFEANFGKLGGS